MNENDTTSDMAGLEEQLNGIMDESPDMAGVPISRRRAMARIMAEQVRNRSMTETQTRAMKFLVSKIGQLEDQTRKALLAGELVFQDADIYFRKRITGGGIQVILETTNIKRTGVSFIDKNSLPDRVNAVVSDIKMAYGYHATKTDPVDITYSTDNTVTGGVGAVPNAIVNGELEISTNDRPIITLPCSGFFRTGGIVQTINSGNDFRTLQGLRLIKEQVPITINHKLADTLSLSTSVNHFIDITFKAVITKSRS